MDAPIRMVRFCETWPGACSDANGEAASLMFEDAKHFGSASAVKCFDCFREQGLYVLMHLIWQHRFNYSSIAKRHFPFFLDFGAYTTQR